jgi:zinc protease
VNPKGLKYILSGVVAFLVSLLCLLEAAPFAMPPVQRMVLSNGLVVLFSEDHTLPFFTLQLLIDCGSGRDPEGEEGLSNMAARTLPLGTTTGRTSSDINEVLDFMGASLTAFSGRDYTTVTFRSLKKDLDKGLHLLIEVITRAAFPRKEVRREVKKTLAQIQSYEDQPGEVAERAFRRALFLSGPYAHPVEGTKESVKGITREKIMHFYKAFYHPNNAILTVVGDITAEDVKARISPLFERWKSGATPSSPEENTFEKGKKNVNIDRKIAQANIVLGNKGIDRQNPDFYALSVMNYVLGGGGFASRLVEEIRDKKGLAYSVMSFLDPGKYPASFQVALQTKNASAMEAISLVLKEMERMRDDPVSEKELDGAKKYLIGSFPLRLDTQAKLAAFLSQMEYYGLGLDYPERYPSLIMSVTREEVQRVAKIYLHPDRYVLVVVADLEEAGLKSGDGGRANQNR